MRFIEERINNEIIIIKLASIFSTHEISKGDTLIVDLGIIDMNITASI